VKTLIQILFLATLVTLTSCGAPKTSAKLEVTNSALAMSNNSFEGGLVISGKSKVGEFTIPVDFNSSGASTSITLDLPKAEWTFTAVAWAGGGTAPKTFQGTTTCAASTVNLQNDNEVVNLKLLAATCTARSDLFGPSAYFTGSEYKKLRVATCGWLYETAGQKVDQDTAMNYCRQANTGVPDIYKKYAKTMKVEIPKIVGGKKIEGLSICLNADAEGYFFGKDLSLPARGLPIRIKLYESANCQPAGHISTFNLTDGFEGPQESAQDLVYVDNQISEMHLFLPSNKLKLGYTGFYDSLPRLTCNGADCMNLPSSVDTGAQRIIESDQEFLLEKASDGRNLRCSDINGVTPIGTISPSAPTVALLQLNCRKEDNGDLVTKFSFSTLSSAGLTISYARNGAALGSSTLNFYSNSSAYNIFKNGWEYFGYGGVPADSVQGSFELFYREHGDKKRGILSKITNMFSPDGPAGVLGNINCVTTTKESTISFFEDLEFKNYRVRLESAPTGAEASLVGSKIYDLDFGSSFEFPKRLLVQRLEGAVYKTEIVIDFVCGEKIGRLESLENKDGREERTILEWNTRSDGGQKVFSQSKTVESDASGVKNYRSEVVEVSQSSSYAVQVFSTSLNITRNGSFYDYDATKRYMKSDATPGVDRVYSLEGNAQANSLSSIDDSNFDDASPFIAAIDSPTAGCVVKSSPTFTTVSDSPCSSMAGPASSSYSSFILGFDTLVESVASAVFSPALPELEP
jgi:hypothetical protein